MNLPDNRAPLYGQLYRYLLIWYRQPCGIRDVITIAFPLVVSMSSWSVMHFIDRLCLTWSSPEALAACMPAGMLHFTVYCFPAGIAFYCTTFVAQYWGANRPKQIAKVVWQGIYIGLFSVPAVYFSGWLAPWFFDFMGHAPEVARQEVIYYQTLALCGGACVILGALTSFFNGLGKTWVVMLVDTFGTTWNLVMCVLLIFGTKGPFLGVFPPIPALGILGAGIATSSAVWIKTLIYTGLFLSPYNRRTFHTWTGRGFNWPTMRRLLYFGTPNGFHLFIENGSFTVMLLLVTMIGVEAAAATNLAFNVNALAFIPIVGLGTGLTALVAQQQGRKQPRLSVRATRTTLVFALMYQGFFSTLYFCCPHWFLFAHESGATAEFMSIANLTVFLMKFLALYAIFDCLNVIYSSTLRGAGDTQYVMRVAATVSPLAIFVAYSGIRWFDGGTVFCWSMLFLWSFSLFLCYYWRYLLGKWRTMQVIEPDVASSPKRGDCGNR